MRSGLMFGAMAATAIGMLTAPAALASAESAVLTMGRLEAQGFDVTIDRIGSAPLSQCVVTDIRNPHDQTQLVRVDGPAGNDKLVPVVVRRSITVTADCSQ